MRGLFSRRVLFFYSTIFEPCISFCIGTQSILEHLLRACIFFNAKRAIIDFFCRNSSFFSHPQMYYLNLGRLPSAKARTPSRKSSVAPKEF